MGLLDPATSDGRVIFFLPWLKGTSKCASYFKTTFILRCQYFIVAGTTDNVCEVSRQPAPTEDDISFILSEIKNYLNKDVDVRRGDVLRYVMLFFLH